MPQLTLAAHYGPKVNPEQRRFASYARACQAAVLNSALGQYFTPYVDAQLHGTLIGLEAVAAHSGITVADRCNANLYAQTGELRAMDFDCVLELARTLPALTIRFGGFQPDDKRIGSMGADAFIRSFQIQWRQGKVIIIGWHHAGGDCAQYTRLWALRQRFAGECGVAHKYQADSDFYVTIGELRGVGREPAARQSELHAAGQRLAANLCHQLANQRCAIDLPVGPEDLHIVRYHATTLDLATSQAYPVTDPRLDARFLAQLYR